MRYTIFTDGSYKSVTGVGEFCGCAATITREGSEDPVAVLTKVIDDDMVAMHNVAGEIIAVIMALEHCLSVIGVTKEDTLEINHDYVGIHNWTKRVGEAGYWKAKNQYTQSYRNYMNNIVKTSTNVEFKHTPGHSGIAGNEYVDKLAREAIDNHVKALRSKR